MIAIPRRRIAATLTSVLLAVMVLGVGSTAAVPPPASWGSTTPDDVTTGASPTMVSPGGTVLLQSSWRNDSNSTISQLFLKGFTTDASIYNAGTVASPNYLITAKVNGNTISTACVKSSSLSCTFKNIKMGTVVHVEAVYAVPDPFTAGPVACPFGRSQGYGVVPDTTIYDPIDQPAACIHFEWSSVGAPSSDGGASHGDTWNWFDAVRVNSSTDFDGRYQLSGFAGFVETNQLIGDGNPQATWASSRGATKIPLTVLDGAGAADLASCNSVLVNCSTGLWGEWSLVNVNDGNPISGVTLYEFRILFDSSEIPQGINASNIEIYHYWDGGEELISAVCTFNPKKATVPNNVPPGCLVATNASGGDIAVTIWTTHNGGLRGSF